MPAKSKTKTESNRASYSKIPIPVSRKKLVHLQTNSKSIQGIFVSSTPVRKTETKNSKKIFDSSILATCINDLSRCSVSPIKKYTSNGTAETISKPSILSDFKQTITSQSVLPMVVCSSDEDDIFPNSKNEEKDPRNKSDDKRSLKINTRKKSRKKIIKENINSNVDNVVIDKKIEAHFNLKDAVKMNLRCSTKSTKDQQVDEFFNMNLIKNAKKNASNKKNIKTMTKTALQNPANLNKTLRNNRTRRSTINSKKILQIESEQIKANKKREKNTVQLKKNNSLHAKNVKITEKNNQKNNKRMKTKAHTSLENLHSALESATSKKISFDKNNLRNPTNNLNVVRRSSRTKYYAKQYWIANAVLRPHQ